jgi:hypothetical protein
MRIASENSEIEIPRNRVMGRVKRTLRELTANIMRVARGAGKPGLIERQAAAFVKALIKYDEITGLSAPPDDLAKVLYTELDAELIEWSTGGNTAQHYAEETVIRGSLQITASRLLNQHLLAQAGKNEMLAGIRDLERIRREA